jgi:hypothetical protein
VIVIGALMAAESGRHESYPDTVGSVVIALCLYWLAHAYANVLGHRLQTHTRLSYKDLWRALRDESAILTGAALPLLALLLAWAVGATQATGVEAALWTSRACSHSSCSPGSARGLADLRSVQASWCSKPAWG